MQYNNWGKLFFNWGNAANDANCWGIWEWRAGHSTSSAIIHSDRGMAIQWRFTTLTLSTATTLQYPTFLACDAW